LRARATIMIFLFRPPIAPTRARNHTGQGAVRLPAQPHPREFHHRRARPSIAVFPDPFAKLPHERLTLEAPGQKISSEPEPVSPGLMGQIHSSDLPAGRGAPRLQTLDKRQQPLAARVQHMARMPSNPRQLDRRIHFFSLNSSAPMIGELSSTAP
jgi:hypothetical protein